MQVLARAALGRPPRELPPFDLTLTATPLSARAQRGVDGLEGRR